MKSWLVGVLLVLSFRVYSSVSCDQFLRCYDSYLAAIRDVESVLNSIEDKMVDPSTMEEFLLVKRLDDPSTRYVRIKGVREKINQREKFFILSDRVNLRTQRVAEIFKYLFLHTPIEKVDLVFDLENCSIVISEGNEIPVLFSLDDQKNFLSSSVDWNDFEKRIQSHIDENLMAYIFTLLDTYNQFQAVNPVITKQDWCLIDSDRLMGKETERCQLFNLKGLYPPNLNGWFTGDNAKGLRKCILENNVETVVEVGSWLGKSTRFIASLLPKSGKVYAVDHWLGGEDHQGLGRRMLSTIYDQFLSNLIHASLADKVIPIRMGSLKAAQTFKEKVDLIYIDASHKEEDVYNDLCAWYPFIRGHGILCGDDWSWGKGFPVRRAIMRFADENNLRIHPTGNFWVISE